MSSSSRHVRHLRLQADSERAIQRAALLLEDALRTASLPDQAGRIVLVRRLALGRIDTQAAPQTLALALERTIARVTAACVYVEDENAAQAPAVWFRDALDAHTKLALRLVSGSPVDAWYWPLAVAAWRPHSAVPVALRRIMFSLATLPEAPVALPRWVAALASAGYIEQIVAALRADDIAPLASAAHVWIPTPVRHKPVARESSAHTLPSVITGIAPSPASERFDPRYVLLRALLRAAEVQAGKASGWITPLLSGETRSGTALDQSAYTRDASVVLSPSVANKEQARRPVRALLRNADSTAPPAAAPPRRGDTIERDRDDISLPSRFEDRYVDTRAGGLLFLIPVLQRLGFQEWLNAQPDWPQFDVARRMMVNVLRQVRVASDDPAWSLAAWRCPAKRSPPRFIAPALWRKGLCTGEGELRLAESATGATLWDASGRLLLGAWADACPKSLVRARRSAAIDTAIVVEADRATLVSNAWLVASRRWLRRHAGIGLSRLILRPAKMALTPTHADVAFAIDLADLRVRRAGLDIDPGWVSWLERVVTFRYEGSGA